MTEELSLCECGCGERVTKPGNRFIWGHSRRGKHHTDEAKQILRDLNIGKTHTDSTKLAMSKASKGKPKSPEHCKAISEGQKGIPESPAKITNRKLSALKEKEPLPDDWEFDKSAKMVTNKECGDYLGCYIAEQVLSKIFKNVQRMPYGNHGFDIICNRDLKIDIKSSATGDKRDGWMFTPDQNKIADYFLCVAFDNREDLNPEHLWLIPGHVINDRVTITISKSTLHKWAKYEQPIDKAILCCNEMRG